MSVWLKLLTLNINHGGLIDHDRLILNIFQSISNSSLWSKLPQCLKYDFIKCTFPPPAFDYKQCAGEGGAAHCHES